MISSIITLYHIAKKRNINALAFVLCVFSLILYAVTEILSIFHGLNRYTVMGFWGVCVIVSWIYLIKTKALDINGLKQKITNLKPYNYGFLLWIAVLGFMAWNTVPYNWDSMTYHLARVINWINNGSVDFYSVGIKRQLYSPVLSEYIVTHLYLLLGSDIASNMVQWGAYTVNCFILYSCCKKLEISKNISYIIVLLYMMAPLTIAEAITTEVDLVGVMWFLLFLDSCIAVCKLEKLDYKKQCLSEVWICVTSVVLGYLSKSNVCIAMLPFLVLLLIRCIKRHDKIKDMIVYFTGALVELVILACPVFIRNYKYFGDILASECVEKLKIGTWNPKYVIVNICKNYSLTACNSITKPILSKVVPKIANILKVDINDPLISYTSGFPDQLPVSYGCDVATCSIIGILFIITLITTIILIFFKKYKNLDVMIAAFTACMMGMAYIKFQVWGSRLLLVFVILMCVFIGCAIENIRIFVYDKNVIKNRIWFYIVCILLLISGIPAIKYNSRYMMMNFKNEEGRNKMYFADRKNIYDQYVAICDYVNNLEDVHCIGVYIAGDMYEYPLWKMLDHNKYSVMQAVEDEKLKPSSNEIPDYIIAIGRVKMFTDNDEYAYNGNHYTVTYDLEGDRKYLILKKD